MVETSKFEIPGFGQQLKEDAFSMVKKRNVVSGYHIKPHILPKCAEERLVVWRGQTTSDHDGFNSLNGT